MGIPAYPVFPSPENELRTLGRRGFQFQEGGEHDLFAIEVERLGTGEKTVDLVP